MPELPEVESVAVSLNALLTGRRIEEATLLRNRLAPQSSPDQFASSLSKSTIRFVGRRGKHILFDLDNGRTLIVHLRMSGQFILLDAVDADPQFTHACFWLENGRRLVFRDQRHFGFMKIATTKELGRVKELSKLAPEPFSDDFSPEYLYLTLKRSRRSLKEILIDQTKVCGLGNIYASEALFRARMHPAKRGLTMTRPKSLLLHAAVRDTLAEAMHNIAYVAATASNGKIGQYGERVESFWQVYEREKEPCTNCGTPIRRLKQGGRSTYLCPVCQRR